MSIRHWLTTPADQRRTAPIQRFDPAYWTLNFPSPMMGALTTVGAAGLQADFHFLTQNDIAGIIWDSVDALDHPLRAYETKRDYRGLTLAFRWRQQGDAIPLDGINGPVLTLEGRDARGVAKSWYVRLWNYAVGAADDAVVTLAFDALAGGYSLPADADPVWAGDIDRMFISVVPAGFSGVAAPLAGTGAQATVTLSDMAVSGAGVVLARGDAFLPEHRLNIAGGYDDVYNITPERMLGNIMALGYRGTIDHYLGISHFARLAWNPGAQRYLAGAGTPLNTPCQNWHADFFKRATDLGYKIQIALSFELLDAYCPDAWKQRAFDGTPALTGYTPPSTLLSPANDSAMDFLISTLDALLGLLLGVGADIIFQMGEPWWWSGLGSVRKPCFYDAAVLTKYPQETGQPVPPAIQSATAAVSPAQSQFLTWLATILARATLAVAARAKAARADAQTTLLIYVPQIVDDAAPLLAQANLPIGWHFPAFDRLQLEDYEFVQLQRWHQHRVALADVRATLGYPSDRIDYFAGFADQQRDGAQWRAIVRAASAPGDGQTYIWAYPQVMRDGVILIQSTDEATMIDAVQFPLALGYGSTGGPEFSTTIAQGQSGQEFRNQNWAQARRRYDASVGVRSEQDIATLLAFFEARQGAARGFLYRDPLDFRSTALSTVSPADQQLGRGDGVRSEFALVKNNGASQRRITRHVAASVRVAVAGVVQNAGWALGRLGMIEFTAPPPAGALVTAGFEFDVPVRFENDALAGKLATFAAGDGDSIPLIEIREA